MTGVPQETDEQIIARLRGGEERAFELLVQRYRSRVQRLALRFMRSREEAEEVSQEVFLTIYRKLAQFEGKSSFSTWLYRVAVNASLMRLRSQEQTETVPIDELAGDLVGDEEENVRPPDSRLHSEEALAQIERAMENLPEEFKTIIILRDIEDFSNEETAEIMDLSVAAVKSRLHRARGYLRKRLEEVYRESTGK